MMMNRDKLSFWVRLVSIVLAAFFLLSFIFLGLGTNISYNLFELIGNQDQQQQQADQAPDPQDQIANAEKALKKDPKDPEKIKDLAALYYTAGRYDDAIQVLQRGQEVAPKDEEIPALIGAGLGHADRVDAGVEVTRRISPGELARVILDLRIHRIGTVDVSPEQGGTGSDRHWRSGSSIRMLVQ